MYWIFIKLVIVICIVAWISVNKTLKMLNRGGFHSLWNFKDIPTPANELHIYETKKWFKNIWYFMTKYYQLKFNVCV